MGLSNTDFLSYWFFAIMYDIEGKEFELYTVLYISNWIKICCLRLRFPELNGIVIHLNYIRNIHYLKTVQIKINCLPNVREYR